MLGTEIRENLLLIPVEFAESANSVTYILSVLVNAQWTLMSGVDRERIIAHSTKNIDGKARDSAAHNGRGPKCYIVDPQIMCICTAIKLLTQKQSLLPDRWQSCG